MLAQNIGRTTIIVKEAETDKIAVIPLVVMENSNIEPMVKTYGGHTISLKVDGTVWTYGIRKLRRTRKRKNRNNRRTSTSNIPKRNKNKRNRHRRKPLPSTRHRRKRMGLWKKQLLSARKHKRSKHTNPNKNKWTDRNKKNSLPEQTHHTQ